MRLRRPDERTVLAAQGVYFAVTGLWPLVHYASFEAVLGPKRDDWLVKTFGALVVPIGAAFLVAAARGRVVPEVRVLSAGTAVALGTADAVYASRGRISRLYLVDAAIEAGLMAALLVARRR